jgi:hypothetical protein
MVLSRYKLIVLCFIFCYFFFPNIIFGVNMLQKLLLTQKNSIHIIALTSTKNFGDNDNAQGIIDQFKALSLTQNIKVSDSKIEIINNTTAPNKIEESVIIQLQKELALESNTSKSVIMIAPGAHGLNAIEQVFTDRFKKPDNVFVIHTAHQVNKTFNEKVIGLIDLSAFPSSAINENDILQKQLIAEGKIHTNLGVPHSATPDFVKIEYQKVSDLYTKDKSLLVMLSGNAPTDNGEIKFYTSEEAKKLGLSVGEKAKKEGLSIIATNSNRTGDRDPISKASLQFHTATATELDPVSKAFIEGVSESGLDKDKLIFKDFKSGDTKNLTLKQMLGRAIMFNEEIYLPGESTSSITMAIELIPHELITMIETKSMNEIHNRFMADVLKLGSIKCLDLDMKNKVIEAPKDEKSDFSFEPSAKSTAQKLLDLISSKDKSKTIASSQPSLQVS